VRFLLALLLLVAAPGFGATLAERLDAVLARPAARRASWGILITDLATGRPLYQHNAHRLFVPASNMKLFTTALALTRLGPGHRYLTRLASTAPPDENGRLAGDLVLVGGGDPNFSSRVLPYNQRTEFSSNPLQPLEDLAEQVAALGVREITGNIIGDDTWFPWQRYVDSWDLEDIVLHDGAPVTALAFNDNVVALRLRPGAQAGERPLVSFQPPSEFYTVDNRASTVMSRTNRRVIRISREPGERVIHVTGDVVHGTAGESIVVSVDDPALFAAQALREALIRRSIHVTGLAVGRHEPAPEVTFTLASLSSMPLIEDLRLTNKVSQNLHAEIMLREVARERRGSGSLENGLAELREFAGEADISGSDFLPEDGCGLSRKNLVTPSALVALLTYMWNSPQHDMWLETLPVSGEDGNLRLRYRSTPLGKGQIHAKTGSMTHVSALSGYFLSAEGPLAFSILANNTGERNAPLRALIDQLLLAVDPSAPTATRPGSRPARP
jgi:D-alanyl-D-alanine carboxypeptidase/D-alanyl-D-alanine-endopeptidase (penicillin-binding protein 4)